MKESIFRKKSLDKVNSPENLNDYIRVSNPGIWVLLVSVIVLLIGFGVWGIGGYVEKTVKTVVRVENGESICYVTEENINAVSTGMNLKVNGVSGTIVDIGAKEAQGFVCSIEMDGELNAGVYSGDIITEKIRPISFIMN